MAKNTEPVETVEVDFDLRPSTYLDAEAVLAEDDAPLRMVLLTSYARERLSEVGLRRIELLSDAAVVALWMGCHRLAEMVLSYDDDDDVDGSGA